MVRQDPQATARNRLDLRFEDPERAPSNPTSAENGSATVPHRVA